MLHTVPLNSALTFNTTPAAAATDVAAPQASYGLKVEGAVLEALVAKKLPKVDAHLTKLGTSSSAMVAPWLSCLFTTVLPSEVTARVFDALLLEGNKVRGGGCCGPAVGMCCVVLSCCRLSVTLRHCVMLKL
jgi:hypothetical protein